jgi:hypothetical protein
MKEEEMSVKTEAGDIKLIEQDVTRLFHNCFNGILDALSMRFPHTRDDGSSNEAEYKAIRAKILRIGNDQLRILPKVLSAYCVQKVADVEIQVKNIN